MNSPLKAETIATGVGLITAAIGAALASAPRTAARAIGVQDATRPLALIGVVDLAIAWGLLTQRPRWRWMLARAAANPPTAAYFALLGRRNSAAAPYVAAAVIGSATVVDLFACRSLYASQK
ncbi:hypothetical protein MSAS_19870 [Mycobacterium saskatchewanense]|uniref:Uncharacterized protein n=1 Tax=Mycobacterium saskatchewanense TaxID=220927 RepID=A0AAJ3TX19_9MYCO|nr:hypothetical protein [Mycobacterium saskatchewanense]ORW72161.1 hypothetical protein AWC23_11605 [Mycobacterium saskatchewanense]BBX62813.1 hypothetical protein MSAS_19870 [Mycobacterium saskatchewanense]